MHDDPHHPNVTTAPFDFLFTWARRSSLWWLQFGLACCGVEMVAAAMPRWDLPERFGMWYRPTPRQADLLIIAGTVTRKMAPVVRQLYDQMPEPKWVIAMGSCACTGRPYDTYAVVQGVDQVIPVDVYVPGCPPTPEALYYGVLILQDRVIGHAKAAQREDRSKAEQQPPDERNIARSWVTGPTTVPSHEGIATTSRVKWSSPSRHRPASWTH